MAPWTKVFPLLLVAFLVSVLIRWPNLDRPLSKHHEFCTAVALRVMDIWDQDGVATYHYNPVMTYGSPGDKFINNHASGSGEMIDEAGNYYYVSHPPLAYYLPYFTFQALGIKPSVKAIQYFHLLINFLCAIGIFFIVMAITDGAKPEGALVAYLLYLFNPATLWFQSNTYMSDMLVQLFFIWGIWAAIKVYQTRELGWLTLLGGLIFLMIYTTWLGVFFSGAVMAYTFYKYRFTKVALIINAVIILAIGLSLGLIIAQYSSINGLEAYKAEVLHRFAQRSVSGSYFGGILIVAKNYLTSYLPMLLFWGVIMLLKRKHKYYLNEPAYNDFLMLAVIPVALLHLLLMNYSGHDFTTLYASVFLTVYLGLNYPVVRKLPWKPIGKVAIFLVLLAGIFQYYYINRPGDFSQSGEHYDTYQKVGEQINQQMTQGHLLCISGIEASPELIYYAKRNVVAVNDEMDAWKYAMDHYPEMVRLKKETAFLDDRFLPVVYIEVANGQVVKSKYLKKP